MSPPSPSGLRRARPTPWDRYAPFYDWENARTMGRRDVDFWKRFAAALPRGRILELGCGTGRLAMPLARSGARLTGVDFSGEMLARAATRAHTLAKARRPRLVRGDIRALPFGNASFGRVLAPYGVLQSLTADEDLAAALREARRVLRAGGRLGIDLVPDLKDWRTYQKQVRFRGKLGGAAVTLIESVRQRRKAELTIFDEDFRVGAGRAEKRFRFSLTFRTVPMEAMVTSLIGAGFEIETLSGSYAGAIWNKDAAVWLLVARAVT